MVWIEEEETPFRVLIGKLSVKRPSRPMGRPRRRWVDNTKCDPWYLGPNGP